MSKMMKIFMVICICVIGGSSLVFAVEDPKLSVLPDAVRKVVNCEFPGARIDDVDDGEFDGIFIHQVDGTSADGVEFQLEIGADGTLYQKDEKVSYGVIEKAVLATLKKQIGNNSPDSWKRMTEYGKVYYEIKAMGMGKEIGLKIDVIRLSMVTDEIGLKYAEILLCS